MQRFIQGGRVTERRSETERFKCHAQGGWGGVVQALQVLREVCFRVCVCMCVRVFLHGNISEQLSHGAGVLLIGAKSSNNDWQRFR